VRGSGRSPADRYRGGLDPMHPRRPGGREPTANLPVAGRPQNANWVAAAAAAAAARYGLLDDARRSVGDRPIAM